MLHDLRQASSLFMVGTLSQAVPVVNKVGRGAKIARTKVSMDATFMFALVLVL